MKFTREELAAVCYKECPDAEILEDKSIFRDLPSLENLEVIGKAAHWSIYHIMVFRYGDKFYRGTYIVGSTESIEEELNAKEIECPEVEQKEAEQKTGVKKYVWTVKK